MASIVAPVQVEIFSDVVCPWCFIGKTRFDRALERLETTKVTVVYNPFQLDPTAPTGTSSPVLEAYAKKFGGPERAQAIIHQVSATAAEDGLHFAMDKALRANTALAHRLLLAAESHGLPSTQAALYEGLFRAYFVEGIDIGDPDALVLIATHAGLEESVARDALTHSSFEDALARRLARAAEMGITAVPTFVIDGKWSIPGAQDVDFFERTLRRLLESS